MLTSDWYSLFAGADVPAQFASITHHDVYDAIREFLGDRVTTGTRFAFHAFMRGEVFPLVLSKDVLLQVETDSSELGDHSVQAAASIYNVRIVTFLCREHCVAGIAAYNPSPNTPKDHPTLYLRNWMTPNRAVGHYELVLPCNSRESQRLLHQEVERLLASSAADNASHPSVQFQDESDDVSPAKFNGPKSGMVHQDCGGSSDGVQDTGISAMETDQDGLVREPSTVTAPVGPEPTAKKQDTGRGPDGKCP